jgi:anti-sigma factor RsiW
MRNLIECSNEPMRDLLPEYVLGTLTSAEYFTVSAHLTGCEACAAEVQLIRSVSAAYPTPALDIAGIVAALPTAPARVRPVLTVSSGGATTSSSGALRPRQWRLAAALSFIVLGGISLATLRGVMRQSASTDIPIAAVDSSLSALAAVPALASDTAPAVDDPIVTATAHAAEIRGFRVEASGLSIGAAADLSDAQLQRLLSELETVEALPITEPAPSHHPMTVRDSPEDIY